MNITEKFSSVLPRLTRAQRLKVAALARPSGSGIMMKPNVEVSSKMDGMR